MSVLQSTNATVVACHCGAVILTGWAEGLRAHVDPVALNQAGMVAAILAGRQLYAISARQLVHRDASRMKMRGPTLVAHECLHPIPAEYRATPIGEAIVEVADDPERIPF